MARPRLMPDNFTLLLVTTVILASVLPCRGLAAQIANVVTNIAIGLLFFLHGAKLSRHALVAGITHWRLHLLVFSFTFIAFPLLGWALQPLLAPLVTPELYLGVLFMCALPATVQSSIAFVSMARGNVSAAVCSASLSSLIGIFLTPLLVRLLLDAHGGSDGQSTLDAIVKICVQLLLPFIVGQLLRPVIGKWVDQHKGKLKFVDQGSILMVVYTAFSAAVIEGLWQQTPVLSLVGLVFICATLLTLVLLATRYSARLLGMSKEDEITVVFCGSKKSLATGVPMAKVLFAGSTMGPVLLPIMLFHQLQLMVCAVLAQRYARRQVVEAAPPVAIPLPK